MITQTLGTMSKKFKQSFGMDRVVLFDQTLQRAQVRCVGHQWQGPGGWGANSQRKHACCMVSEPALPRDRDARVTAMYVHLFSV